MKKWKAVAKSAIGVMHQTKQLPCQDYSDYLLLNEHFLIGAVADGAGSAKYADKGAKLAVDSALNYLKSMGETEDLLIIKDNIEEEFNKLIDSVLKTLKSKTESLECNLADLASTLLVFVASVDWIAALQIGDGFLVCRPRNGEFQLIFEPDKGEYANETTFITSVNGFEAMQTKVIEGENSFICAATDGLEKVAIQLKNWQPFPPFFVPLEGYLRQSETLKPDEQYLHDFLNSERLNARTNDDKTLLLALLSDIENDNSYLQSN